MAKEDILHSSKMDSLLCICCRNVLNVFIKENVYSFPSQYVSSRWTVNAKKNKMGGVAIEDLEEGRNRASSTSLFNSIMVEFLELSERGSRSKKYHDIAIQTLRKEITELDRLDIEEPNEGFDNSTFKVMPKVSND
ncbi:hypothetical protein MTR_6g053640 [Medicago truncatula]|uniref:Protein FAR1-RELATED SEQUENCE n=1 Tax=Medicago truncatula TaxID=3880 RepID=A0A072UAF9_MEDTR|nr:hypothetical protein MTR_6g053640 [Medicago truncatula]